MKLTSTIIASYLDIIEANDCIANVNRATAKYAPERDRRFYASEAVSNARKAVRSVLRGCALRMHEPKSDPYMTFNGWTTR